MDRYEYVTHITSTDELDTVLNRAGGDGFKLVAVMDRSQTMTVLVVMEKTISPQGRVGSE